MPNWCSNSLTIKGDASTLVALKEIIESDKEGLLEAIAPIGEWEYGTAVETWGTKWDISSEGLEYTDNGDGTAEITGWFDSAWSPPVDAFQKLADDWDSCYIELLYEESGMCFVGCWDSEGGDDYYEYSDFTSDNIKDNIPAYLVEHFALDERLDEYEQEEEASTADELAN
jgi:hypothetical protein